MISDRQEIAVQVRFGAPRSRAGPNGATVLTVSGLAYHRIPGERAWPYRSVLVAVPPTASFTLEFDDPEERPLLGRLPAVFHLPPAEPGAILAATDPPRAGPPRPVEMDMEGWLRHRRVVRLLFHPLTPQGTDGAVFHPLLTAHLRLRIAAGQESGEVFRVQPAARERAPDAALTRGGEIAGAARRPDPFAPVYAATLLNEAAVDPGAYGEAVERLRTRRMAGQKAPSGALGLGSPDAGLFSLSGGAAAGGGPLPAKIRVRDEGVWSVSQADLLAAGIDASGTPVADLSLSAGGTSVPLRVVDDGNGLFDGTDRVEFYGVGLSGNLETDTNVYRLAFDEGPGSGPALRDATPSGGIHPASFRHTARFESNQLLFTNLPDSDGDLFTWRAITEQSSTVTSNFDFTLPNPDPLGAALNIRFRLVSRIGSSHTTDLLLNGTNLLDTRTWSGTEVTHAATALPSLLAPGTNTVSVQLSGSGIHQVLANWFEVDYSRLFVASGDQLAFSTDLPAPVEYQISGFTTPDPVAYDVTDPGAPVRLTGGTVSGTAPDFTLTFTDSLGGPRRFIVRAGSVLPPDPLQVDQPSSWRDPGNGADLIIVSYPDFLPDLAPLVAARQAQGLRVALVDVDDAYDEFSSGRTEPAGINGLVSYAFSNWQPPAPASLLLVGNATLDPRRLLSNPTGVPLIMPTGTFTAPTLGVASTDNAFVTVAGADSLPDLNVGRIPAQTSGDVAAAVAKILDYETLPLENLNRKVLLVADNDDLSFETFQEDLVSLYLAGTRLPVERAYSRLLGTTATNTKIRNDINDGALMVNYLGHGNIHNWAAENLFVDTLDIPLLTNSDRPFFLTTLNCINGLHAAPRGSNVTSLAEMALVQPGKGAMGVWSPSALGTLTDYAVMSNILFRLIFTDRVANLGTVTTTAKVEAFTNQGISSSNLDEMTLFGDPSVDLRVDGDRDGLSDADEDGCACGLDARDADTDDDGLVDGAEPTPEADSDGDGVIDALDPDADDDGLPDGLEAGVGGADPDTDLAAGFFRPDLDPVSTTDPRSPDTDGGGAPDGAEDRDADGQVGGAETDPDLALDDAACGPVPPPELAHLASAINGADLVLSWDDLTSQDPCVLYRVLEASLGPAPPGVLPPLVSRTVTTQAGAILAGEADDPGGKLFLVVAVRPGFGDGPTGH
ncbi:MAG: C25 family cysteine peptidase [Acidobacteriota bacterium]